MMRVITTASIVVEKEEGKAEEGHEMEAEMGVMTVKIGLDGEEKTKPKRREGVAMMPARVDLMMEESGSQRKKGRRVREAMDRTMVEVIIATRPMVDAKVNGIVIKTKEVTEMGVRKVMAAEAE